MALPRPAEILPKPVETNISHTGRLCEKTLQEHPRSCKASGATPAGALAPPRNSTTSKREECPINKHQPLRGPNGYHRRGSGATVRDSHWGPLKHGGKHVFFANNKTQMNSRNIKHVRYNHGPVAGARGPGGLSGPPERSAPAPLGRNSVSLEGHNVVLTRLRLARGLDAPSGETPPRSRAGRPLGRDSVSLEALTSSPLPHPLPRPEHLMF
jgi:hypothetical protein